MTTDQLSEIVEFIEQEQDRFVAAVVRVGGAAHPKALQHR
jgi:hypothetical protein